ncbi:MAG: hypothetical protein ACE5KA_07740 [Nitrososphaerales archaeon]
MIRNVLILIPIISLILLLLPLSQFAYAPYHSMRPAMSYSMSVSPNQVEIGESITLKMLLSNAGRAQSYTFAITVTDPAGASFKSTVIFSTNSYGEGSKSISYPSDFAKSSTLIPGKYAIKVDQEAPSFKTNIAEGSFKVIRPAEVVTISELQFVDQTGSPVDNVSVGQQFMIQSDVKNKLGLKQNFAYIVQIKDSNEFTVMLAWMMGTLPPNEEFTLALSWIPELEGEYTVDVFTWESIASPVPLSINTPSSSILVSE